LNVAVKYGCQIWWSDIVVKYDVLTAFYPHVEPRDVVRAGEWSNMVVKWWSNRMVKYRSSMVVKYVGHM
jgi:hypothetical protein